MFVLVAEDDEFYAKVYQIKISEGGHEVLVVGNGLELLRQAKLRRPDIFILDLMMPVKDGFETLAELRSDPILANTKVLVISHLNQPEDIQKVQELSGIYYYKNSLQFNQILQLVDNCCS